MSYGERENKLLLSFRSLLADSFWRGFKLTTATE